MNNSVTICFAYKKERFSEEFIRNLFAKMDTLELLGPSNVKLKNYPKIEEEISRREATIKKTSNGGLGFYHYIQGPERRHFIEIYIHSLQNIRAPNPLIDSTLDVMIFFSTPQNRGIFSNDPIKTQKFLEIMLELIPVIKPIFAWGDDWKKIIKQDNKDHRQFVWGVNYWNKELTEMIGIDKLNHMNGDIWNVKTHPTGGISLSAVPLPFAAPQGQKNKASKQLNLNEKLKAVLIIGPEVKKQVAKDDFW